MSKTPFMPLWVSDFLGDTLDLDAAEIGAYMLLLMAQWNRDGKSLPADQSKLKRVSRCGRNWPKVWGVVERFFDTDENGVYSKRLRLEAQNVAAKREVNAHNGALGGAAKALKDKEASLANGINSLQRNPSIPEPEPYSKKGVTNVTLSPNLSQHFSDFWEAFPHRNGKKSNKQGAEKSFRTALRGGATVLEIADGVRDMHRDPDVARGYGRGPVPWLNQKGWKDEIPEAPKFSAINGASNERPNQSTKTTQRDNALADEILAAARAR